MLAVNLSFPAPPQLVAAVKYPIRPLQGCFSTSVLTKQINLFFLMIIRRFTPEERRCLLQVLLCCAPGLPSAYIKYPPPCQPREENRQAR